MSFFLDNVVFTCYYSIINDFNGYQRFQRVFSYVAPHIELHSETKVAGTLQKKPLISLKPIETRWSKLVTTNGYQRVATAINDFNGFFHMSSPHIELHSEAEWRAHYKKSR